MNCCPHCKWCQDRDTYDEDEKRKAIKYQKVGDEQESNIDVVLPQYDKVPLNKMFEFRQPQCPVPVHPQFIEEMNGRGGAGVVTRQPHMSTCPTDSRISDDSAVNDTEPRLQFSLYYDIQRRTLTVHLLSGTDLPAKDRRGTSDPFVILFLIPNKDQIFESKVHNKTLTPHFDEIFEFTGLLPDEVRRQTLILRVLDKDKLSASDDMGVVIVPLENADLYGVKLNVKLSDELSILNSDSNGDVLISMMYDPSLHLISGVLMKATNLQKMDIGGSADPYIKLYLYNKGSREAKWKSSIKKKTLVPIYNEPFRFDVTDMDIQFVRIELIVMDHDVFGRNDMMGLVQLGEKSDHSTGRLHWTEMISSPRNPISRWHSLSKPMGTLRRLSSKPGTV